GGIENIFPGMEKRWPRPRHKAAGGKGRYPRIVGGHALRSLPGGLDLLVDLVPPLIEEFQCLILAALLQALPTVGVYLQVGQLRLKGFIQRLALRDRLTLDLRQPGRMLSLQLPKLL